MFTCVNRQWCADKHSNKCRDAAKVRPRTGAVRKVNAYWEQVEQYRLPEGLPHWAFDFISVHKSSLSGKYSLMSPMLLVCSLTGKRPDWEDEQYDTKATAVKRAQELARNCKLSVFVVDCTPSKVEG